MPSSSCCSTTLPSSHSVSVSLIGFDEDSNERFEACMIPLEEEEENTQEEEEDRGLVEEEGQSTVAGDQELQQTRQQGRPSQRGQEQQQRRLARMSRCGNRGALIATPVKDDEDSVINHHHRAQSQPNNNDIPSAACTVGGGRTTGNRMIEIVDARHVPEDDDDRDDDDGDGEDEGSNTHTSNNNNRNDRPDPGRSTVAVTTTRKRNKKNSIVSKDDDIDSCMVITSSRAQIISVSVDKKLSDDKLGIVLETTSTATDHDSRHHGGSATAAAVRVKRIREDGILHGCPIRAGDRVIRVNGLDCRSSSTGVRGNNSNNRLLDMILRLLRDTVGLVEIVVENDDGDPNLVECMVEKRSVIESVGIRLRRPQDHHEFLEIENLKEVGRFNKSLLSVGDRVLTINGIACHRIQPGVAADVIRSAHRFVSVVAEKANNVMRLQHNNNNSVQRRQLPLQQQQNASNADNDSRGNNLRAEYVSVSIIKRTQDQPVGIRFADSNHGKTVVASFRPDSMLCRSPLRVGDVILSVNGIPCRSGPGIRSATRGHRDVARLVRDMVGRVTIVAQNVGGNCLHVESMVEKTERNDKLGITLTHNRFRSLEVMKITERDLATHTLMNVGDRVLSINSVPCPGMDVSTAAKLIQDSERIVTIIAETLHTTGVVVAVD